MTLSETKGLILSNMDGRISQLEKCGCPAGNIREEKIHNLTENLGYLRKTTNAINDKLFYGLILLVIVAFLAGVNVTSQLVKMVFK
jgi:hypothetical protein